MNYLQFRVSDFRKKQIYWSPKLKLLGKIDVNIFMQIFSPFIASCASHKSRSDIEAKLPRYLPAPDIRPRPDRLTVSSPRCSSRWTPNSASVWWWPVCRAVVARFPGQWFWAARNIYGLARTRERLTFSRRPCSGNNGVRVSCTAGSHWPEAV